MWSMLFRVTPLHALPAPCAATQVGARFLNAALNLVYGQTAVEYLNPAYASACQQTVAGNLVVSVSFSAASMCVYITCASSVCLCVHVYE